MLPINPRPWWEVFIGSQINKANELVDVANAILGTCNLCSGTKSNSNDITLHADWLAASKGFVHSLVKSKDNESDRSFNDPDSFLWFCQKEMFEKEIKTNHI